MSDTKVRKALEIVRGCSTTIDTIHLYNSLLYAELDICACVPLLNELFETNVSCDEVKDTDSVQVFLSHWIPDIEGLLLSDSEVVSGNATSKNVTEKSEKDTLRETKSNIDENNLFKPRYIVGYIVFVFYMGILFFNKCTAYHNELTQESEGYLSSALQILNVIDTVVNPANWLFGVPSLFFDSTTWLNILCAFFGVIYCLVITILLMEDDEEEEVNKYNYQPCIAVLFVVLAIVEGYYGPLAFNLAWTLAVPLSYLALTLLGVGIVRIGFKIFNPQSESLIIVLKTIPFFIWGGTYLFLKLAFL